MTAIVHADIRQPGRHTPRLLSLLQQTAATTGRVVQVSPSLVAVVVAMSGWSGDTRTHTHAEKLG